MTYTLNHILIESCEKYPDKDCIIYNDMIFSYQEILARVYKAANIIQETGTRPGDRVAIHLNKSIEEVVAIMACSQLGLLFVNINPLLKEKQIFYILKHSGARVFITTQNRARRLKRKIYTSKTIDSIICVGDKNNLQNQFDENLIRVFDFHTHIISKRPNTEVKRCENDPAGILYTSGSTGQPKGVVVSHRNLIAGAQSVTEYLQITKQDVILSILPFSFDYGLNQLINTLFAGATIVLQNYLGPIDILTAAQNHSITLIAGIPFIWAELLDLQWSISDFKDLRCITNSGGALSEKYVKEYRRRLPDTDIFLMYGLTEAFRSTYLPPSQIDFRPTSIGKAIPNAEIFVISEAGNLCKPREIGQLVHRGPHVSLGYWKDQEKTNAVFRNNPLQCFELPVTEKVVYSGDYVLADDEGYLYYVGRKDEMIKSSGFRISPTEIEDCFYSTRKVKEAFAFGTLDQKAGQKIIVAVTLRKGYSCSPDELLDDISSVVPSFMKPSRIFIFDTFPRMANGKVDRVQIKHDVSKTISECPATPLASGGNPKILTSSWSRSIEQFKTKKAN